MYTCLNTKLLEIRCHGSNNLKTFVCNCYLSVSSNPSFLCVFMNTHLWVQKCIFPASQSPLLHEQGLVTFQNHARIQNLEILPGECMSTEKSKFAT